MNIASCLIQKEKHTDIANIIAAYKPFLNLTPPTLWDRIFNRRKEEQSKDCIKLIIHNLIISNAHDLEKADESKNFLNATLLTAIFLSISPLPTSYKNYLVPGYILAGLMKRFNLGDAKHPINNPQMDILKIWTYSKPDRAKFINKCFDEELDEINFLNRKVKKLTKNLEEIQREYPRSITSEIQNLIQSIFTPYSTTMSNQTHLKWRALSIVQLRSML